MMASAILKAKPAGNYAFIKGDKGDPNANFLFSGITEVLKPAMDAGKIKNVGESYTDGWKPDNAQKNMEQILTKNNNKVDAVVAENDGMAGGVVAALTAQGMAGSVPVSGQDGDHAAINRVALGTQTVSIWKDSRDLGKVAAEDAVALASGKKMSAIADVKPFSGGAKHVTVNGILLTPLAVTRDNLNVDRRQGLDHQGGSLRRREAGHGRFLRLSCCPRRPLRERAGVSGVAIATILIRRFAPPSPREREKRMARLLFTKE